MTEPFSVLQQKPAQHYGKLDLPEPEYGASQRDMKSVLAELEVLREQFAAQTQSDGKVEFVVPSPPREPEK